MAGAWVRLSWLGLGLLACSEEPPDFTISGAEAGASLSPQLGAPGGGQAGAPAAAGGALPASAAGAFDGAVGAPPDDSSDAGFCTGQAVSVAELASGNVRGGAMVLLPALVASSQKFLVSVSKASGKCWWGAFASEAGRVGENSGVLLLGSADGKAALAAGPSRALRATIRYRTISRPATVLPRSARSAPTRRTRALARPPCVSC
jgi:hypothetical protein